jgi:crotonobetainyl-CoA:carnitine CoA-transferase CaiB-like acyl-CoA transferase
VNDPQVLPLNHAAPLAGLRVLELARILAGPWAGQVLADLGADVIKVESPAGDETRRWGPPFIDYQDGGRDAAYFHSCNRGKRSIVIDFNQAVDRARLHALLQDADVVIENFKQGDLARYGLDAHALCAKHPRLVWCSITGFGATGPKSALPGYDFIIQGMGGIMDLTGEPNGAPQKPGVAYADLFTGMYSVVAIQAALAARQRSGCGTYIDMALFDTQVAVLANQAMNFLASGVSPQRMGNAHPNLVPYQVFKVADGDLIIAVGSDAQFSQLTKVLGLPQLASDARASTNAARVQHRAYVVEQIAARCRNWTRTALTVALQAVGVPVGPIQNVAEVMADPQTLAREMLISPPSRDGEAVPGLRLPVRMTGATLTSARAAPRLGEHQTQSWLPSAADSN